MSVGISEMKASDLGQYASITHYTRYYYFEKIIFEETSTGYFVLPLNRKLDP